jgi:hypothetical protein
MLFRIKRFIFSLSNSAKRIITLTEYLVNHIFTVPREILILNSK